MTIKTQETFSNKNFSFDVFIFYISTTFKSNWKKSIEFKNILLKKTQLEKAGITFFGGFDNYLYVPFFRFFYNIGPIFKKLHPRWSKESDRVIRPKPDYRIILWRLQLFAFLFIQSSGFSLRTQLVKKG